MLHGVTLCFAILSTFLLIVYLIFVAMQPVNNTFPFSQLLSGQVPQNLPIPKPKVEATSENNTASNHSSDDVASMQKTEECSEKGSDAQVWIFSYFLQQLDRRHTFSA